MVEIAIYCLIVLIIGAIAAWIVQKAPMFDGTLKQIIIFAIWAVTGLVIIIKLLELI